MRKVIKLVDNRSCRGSTVRELRHVLREIESGDVVSFGFIMVKRDGTSRSYSDAEDTYNALGAVELLKDKIKERIIEI